MASKELATILGGSCLHLRSVNQANLFQKLLCSSERKHTRTKKNSAAQAWGLVCKELQCVDSGGSAKHIPSCTAESLSTFAAVHHKPF